MTIKGRLTRLHRNSRGKGRLAKTKQVLSDAAYEVKDKIVRMPRGMAGYAKRNPMKTVGISVLAGIALAQLIRLRTMRK